jgi:uncharacterized protein YkwD
VPGRFPPSARLVVPILAAALALHGTAAAADPPTCPPGGADRAAVVCEIDAARAAAGLAAVRSRASLAEAAAAHSADMVERRYFAHESPAGDGPADRARRAGYMRHADTWRIGEVLLWQRGEPLTAAHAVELWLGSPKHRRIVLSRHYRDVGAGFADGAPLGDPGLQPATTLTLVFGQRR